jgi:hypothetical protein
MVARYMASGVGVRTVPHNRSLSLESIGEGNSEFSTYRHDALLFPKLPGRAQECDNQCKTPRIYSMAVSIYRPHGSRLCGVVETRPLRSCWAPVLSPLHVQSRSPRRRSPAPRYLRRRIGVGGCGTRFWAPMKGPLVERYRRGGMQRWGARQPTPQGQFDMKHVKPNNPTAQ